MPRSIVNHYSFGKPRGQAKRSKSINLTRCKGRINSLKRRIWNLRRCTINHRHYARWKYLVFTMLGRRIIIPKLEWSVKQGEQTNQNIFSDFFSDFFFWFFFPLMKMISISANLYFHFIHLRVFFPLNWHRHFYYPDHLYCSLEIIHDF